MSLNDVRLVEAEAYLRQLEQLTEQIGYAHYEFRDRLERYRSEPNPINRTALQSSIAYFEKYIQPLFISQSTPQRQFNVPSATLVVGIDQEWQANEFRQLFHGVDYLNKIYVLRAKLLREAPDLRLSREMTRSRVYRDARLYYYLASSEELRVRSVQFASPGSVSFDGLGDVIRELRETLHYVVTFQFVKGFVDLYDHFRYERPIQQAERRMKLKEVIQIEQSQQRKTAIQNLEDYRAFLTKMNEVADLAVELDRKGLARGIIVEEMAIKSISMLHRLGFEEQKVKLPSIQE